MRAHGLRTYRWSLLLLICLVVRGLTAIYYIEDIDSLRFALSLRDFNVAEYRPHFPGYPVFCALAKLLYLLMLKVGMKAFKHWLIVWVNVRAI